MIAMCREDYSPYLMEEMMQDSRVTEWELWENFPWREVVEAAAAAEEEERLRQEAKLLSCTAKAMPESSSIGMNDDDMQDILSLSLVSWHHWIWKKKKRQSKPSCHCCWL